MAATAVEVVASSSTHAGTSSIDELSDGTILIFYVESAVIKFQYSDDDGATWTAGTGTITPASSGFGRIAMTVDANDDIWVAYIDAASDPRIVRGTYSNGTITYGTSYEFDTTTTYRLNIAAAVFGDVTYIGVIYASSSGCRHEIIEYDDGTYTQEHFATLDTDNCTEFIEIDFHHTGDGVTVADSTPHFYCVYNDDSNDYVRFTKITYSTGPSWSTGTQRTIISSGMVAAYTRCFFDGDQYVIPVRTSTSPYRKVFYRNAADTTTTETDTVTTASASGGRMACFHDADNNIYLYDADAATAEEWSWIKWTRATDSWGSWEDLDTLQENNDTGEFEMAAARHPKGSQSHFAYSTYDGVDTNYIYYVSIVEFPSLDVGGGFGAFGL